MIKIYQNAQKEMKNISFEYQYETDLGDNVEAMRKWNGIVKSALNKDNIDIFSK
ncbi:MAG: hypothetical protein IPO92_22110 [Saprospiraceae bacterium]|nr:hypothetical protein [Saprospiraceae bacterium]